MKTSQTKIRPTPAHRRRRKIPTAFRDATIRPGTAAPATDAPRTAPRPAAPPRYAAHDFLSLCLYPGRDDHTSAA